MIDLSKLTFNEIKQDDQRFAIASVTINARIPIGETMPPDNVLRELAKQTFFRGLYGELVPPIVRLKQFAQKRCAFISDAAELLNLSNEIDAILLGDPTLNKPVEKPLIKPVKAFRR